MAFNTFRCLKFLLKKIVLNFSAFAAEVFGVLSVSNAIILRPEFCVWILNRPEQTFIKV